MDANIEPFDKFHYKLAVEMANNLRSLRQSRSLTQAEAAEALGTTRSQYVKLERGERRLSDVWIERTARALKINPGDVVQDVIVPRQICGRIEHGDAIAWYLNVPPDGIDTAYLDCQGGALGFLDVGWIIAFQCRRIAPDRIVSGCLYVTHFLNDRWGIRKVIKSPLRHRFHLTGPSNTPLFDVHINGAMLIDRFELTQKL